MYDRCVLILLYARRYGENKQFIELMRLYLTIHSDHEGGNVSGNLFARWLVGVWIVCVCVCGVGCGHDRQECLYLLVCSLWIVACARSEQQTLAMA